MGCSGYQRDCPPAIVGPDSVTETYRYDGDGNRATRTANGQTTVYFQGLWEDTLGVNQRKLYSFGGQIVAIRDGAGAVTYLHGDHLGSVSVVIDANGNLASKQEFDPWGSVRAGGITSIHVCGENKSTGQTKRLHAGGSRRTSSARSL